MFKSINKACNFSLVVFKVFTLKITFAGWFCAAISVAQTFSPSSFTPNSSIQSGIDSLRARIFESSSNRPFIFRSGVPSSCLQSGIGYPLKTAQTANIRHKLSRSNGSFTSAISAYNRFHRTIS